MYRTGLYEARIALPGTHFDGASVPTSSVSCFHSLSLPLYLFLNSDRVSGVRELCLGQMPIAHKRLDNKKEQKSGHWTKGRAQIFCCENVTQTRERECGGERGSPSVADPSCTVSP